MRNRVVNSWAYFLFFATIKTPVVSLSILCTAYGDLSLNSWVLRRISKIFFFDFVPDWTEIPEGLFITAKFSLFSINILLENNNSFLLGW